LRACAQAHKDAVTNVFVYCGHSIDGTGLAYDPKQGGYCLNTGLMKGIVALGIAPEIVINSGRSNISDYRAFFGNASLNIPALVAEAARFGAQGISFDLEPQVGSPSSTTADSLLFAEYLTKAKSAFSQQDLRLTVAVAQWCAMTNNYPPLAAATDRLLDMETYGADSMAGWLNGDQFGGDYLKFVKGAGVNKASPGFIPWNTSKCGNHSCWSNTVASGVERMKRIEADGLQEVSFFRIVQQNGAEKMPLEFWWPLLATFLKGRAEESAAHVARS
jgi:hypothetical protein